MYINLSLYILQRENNCLILKWHDAGIVVFDMKPAQVLILDIKIVCLRIKYIPLLSNINTIVPISILFYDTLDWEIISTGIFTIRLYF